ncbi:MAG: hypothetical protein KDD98_00470 [Sphingomonadaceae bacterium]|nr:hypothetical protein [Sphingomonadaceae bacterium]
MTFPISRLYDLEAEWDSTSFPYAGRKGCYAYFDESEQLIYIGKASCNSTIGIRASTYHRMENGKLIATGGSHWPKAAKWLVTIPVHEAHQAPSLEEFLIEVLAPPANVTGRTKI